jgi:TetR/AcrR family transcriptional regulator, cholesterol catabolism regulator
MEEIATREKILAGVESLFMKYGIRSVSMDDIARHLGISKKTLYQHFADKDELVLHMSQVHLERDLKEYSEIAASSRNSIEELNRISHCLKRDMEDLNPSLLFDLQKYHPKAWNLWQEFKEKFIKESVMRNITQGQREGYFRPEINAEIIAVMRVLLVEASFNDQIFSKDKFNFVEIQTHMFEFFVHGLCTDKGKKLYYKYKETQLTNQPHEKVL